MVARRAVLGGLVGSAIARSARARWGGVAASAPPSGVVQTLTLLSTSGSTVSANTPSPPMFGLQFKKGDVPTGQYPILQADTGEAWPATFFNRASWSDGSIKHISVLPGPYPKAITTGGVTANVLNGGSAPAASGIALADLYAELMQLNANGFASSLGTGLGLQGNWAALLANDARNIEQIAYGDGGGGIVWRILTHVQSGGTAHGQLECYWYVQGLVDASGNLAGWRVLPRLTQPWYDVDSPAAKNWRGLQDFNLQYGSGPTTITPPFGYTPADFTWATSPDNYFTVASTNWYNGGGGGSQANIIYVYLTTTGTLPAGLSLNTIYEAIVTSYLPTTIILPNSASSAGSGVHTMRPLPVCYQFGTIWGARADGRYTYIQGAGSAATDAPIQVRFNNTDRLATKVFPPLDLSLSPAPDSNPTTGSGYTYSWDLATLGAITPSTSSTGERQDIGVINSWQARHFHNQAVVDELYIRTIGLAGAYLCDNLRDSTTRMPVRLDDPANSYTGLPSSLATTLNWNTQYGQVDGFTGPSNPASGSQYFNSNEPHHQPHMAAYAYLVTGEPQYLDVEVEIACAMPAAGWTADALRVLPHRNPLVDAVQYYGIVTYESDNGTRKMTWGLRAMIWASGLYPDTDPYGTQIKDYLITLRSTNIQFMNTWIATGDSYLATTGNWVPLSNTNAWMLGYHTFTVSLAAAMCEDADAVTFLNYIATFYSHILTTFSGWQLHDFYRLNFLTGISPDGVTARGGPITSDDLYSSASSVDGIQVRLLTWTAGSTSRAFLWDYGADMQYCNFVPTNDDKIIWPINDGSRNPNPTIPTGFSAATPYYAINVSGDSFDLAAARGGTRITPTTGTQSSAPDDDFGLVAAAPPSDGILTGYPVNDGYLSNFHGSLNYMIAAGISGLTAMKSDTDTRMSYLLTTLGTDIGNFYKLNPKYAFGSTF